MPELLLELFCEEIPARMQPRAAGDLKRLVTDALVERGLLYEGAQAHATPRRLVLSVEGLPGKTRDICEERKGPRVDAPDQAVEGFLRAAGVTREQCEVREDRKGAFLVARIERPGRPAPEVVADIVPQVVRQFPWPKSMRWGNGNLRWVRPLHSILCCFDGEPVGFSIDGISSGNTTRGHRFMSDGEVLARRFEDYAKALRAAHVMVDAGERADVIRAECRNLAFAQGLDWIEDEALVLETAGLVEWPVVLMGAFDTDFLALPPEVIVTSIRTHQKCFSMRDRSGALANRYLLVANLVASDGGARIVEGNDRVIAARLADARFFWDQDRKTRLEDRLPELESVTFHARLGSQRRRVERIEKLAGKIARLIGADVAGACLAARLAKADLVTGMVGEFPELQGQMGRYYALEEGIEPQVADAVRDHYKPQGPSDAVPVQGIAQAVALADKIDMLAGFWAIGEKPTGSKDPYALRRAALGVIRILLENERKLPLGTIIAAALTGVDDGEKEDEAAPREATVRDLLGFLADRLKVYLRDKGARHDLIDAVFAMDEPDDLLLIVKRVEALGRFLDTEDGRNQLAGVKRAANILRIEEKKDARLYGGDPNPNMLIQAEEKALASAVRQAAANARRGVQDEDFEAAMRALAKLRAPVDDFFDHVTVNDKDQSLRDNRLVLLNRVREATAPVADFSRIEG